MSSDLFAAFASQPASGTSPSHLQSELASPAPSRLQPSQPFSFFDDLTIPAVGRGSCQTNLELPKADHNLFPLDSGRSNEITAVIEDADDWGDFEGAPEPQAAAPLPAQSGFQAAYTLTEGMEPLGTLPAREKDMSKQAVSNAAVHRLLPAGLPHIGSQSPKPKKPFRSQSSASRTPSVLFDATELEGGDDDFGDFEEPAAQGRSYKDASADESSKLKLPSARSFASMAPLNNLSATSRPTSQNPFTTQETLSWDEFAEWDEDPLQVENHTKYTNTIATPMQALPSMLPASEPDSSDHEPPPTNIPPPGVLLSLFPSLFSEAQTQLFKPMAAQTFQMKNRILSDHTTVQFLQGYIAIASVAARVIAGRKSRWKRDVHLAQGMRLGPASSRATSGMKLTGIDKSEMNKEEREVLDVVRAWKDQVGRFRSAVAAANAIKPGSLGPVPDIQEVMPVKILREAEGGVPAPQQCALCGLRREERVAKVDIAVEDTFGEWWVEQTRMHRACKNFWEKNRDALRQR